MLTWAGLADYPRWIFTSDGFSKDGDLVEKPSARFFERVEREIARDVPSVDITYKVYVGDNERNDVELPLQLGYKTIRYINKENPKDATWLDHRVETSAHYKYDNTNDLLRVLQNVTLDLRA
jgi:FMN phosphatase YigB (HAD superfamily)